MRYQFFLLLLCPLSLIAQVTFPVNGVHDDRHTPYAFTHMTLVQSPTLTVEDATMIIQDGIIQSTGKGITIPEHAVVIDCSGLTLYPAFIDLACDAGIPEKPKEKRTDGPQMESNDLRAVSWNQAVTPEFSAAGVFVPDTAANRKLRNAGFGAALTHREDGIIRGTGAVILLGDESANEMLLAEHSSLHYSFSKGSSSQDYPSSQMGSIALIRQSLYDAQWYAAGGSEQETNLSLQALSDHLSHTAFFHVSDKLEILRASQIAKEFGLDLIAEGSGNEYQRIDALKQSGAQLIIPLNFPDAPDVHDAWDAEQVALTTLQHWELAPANAAYLEKAGMHIAITSDQLKDKKDFLPNLRKAVKYGLSEQEALSALTTTPAKMAGVSDQIGVLEKGKQANFLVVAGNIFLDDGVLYEVWVHGVPYTVQQKPLSDQRGAWYLHLDNERYGLLIRGKEQKPTFAVVRNTDTIDATGSLSGYNINLRFRLDSVSYNLSGTVRPGHFTGSGTRNGEWMSWNAEKGNVYAEKETSVPVPDTLNLGAIPYPFQAFGNYTQPEPKSWLITNTTVWTNEAGGILEQTDVLISNGKIIGIGKGLSAKDAEVIDGTGMHLTSGIIDEHSHIAISRGVNEGTQSISAEVRIGDVINSEDVNIYRQLAGGVTTSHLLHGSANAIGGQTALIKLRWGDTPEEMKFKGADGFIKFALGENVKQSNWGDDNTIRYPQTRMGVEQIMEDGFTRAEAYIQAKANKNELVRTDLELEALAEILQSKRFITCHSYVQSEINMLMHLAERHGFKVNTFTHILEGYKVADKMAEHGAGGSTFSDWWAYKYEVIEAIPYNAALMDQMGVVTAINSDDAEMARRLNQEAAKAIKYGGLTEEEAWKLVTLNPAKLLHIDDRVGSVKTGKDADLVLWNDNPLSVYARAEKTFIDGRLYYDREEEARKQSAMQAERRRLVDRAANAGKKGERTSPVIIIQEPEYDCDTEGVFTTEQ